MRRRVLRYMLAGWPIPLAAFALAFAVSCLVAREVPTVARVASITVGCLIGHFLGAWYTARRDKSIRGA